MPELKQSPLISLAPELIEAITDELTIDAVKALRLTCKQLGDLLNPRIFRELTINFSQATYENDLSKVRILASTNCHPASFGTRTLNITSLSPTYDPDFRGPPWRKVGDEWVQEPYPEDPPNALVAEEELKGYLFKAIASLKGVQSVVWRPIQKDSDWAQKDVMNALKILPNLRDLLLYTGSCKFPFPLHDLSGIREISVHISGDKHNAETLDNIAKLVARSPKITSIDIASSYHSGEPCDNHQSLHQLFKYYPQSSSRLRLRHLSLRSCLVKLDDVTLPHLQHLTSLSLMNIKDPYNRRSSWGNVSLNPQSKDVQAYGSSLDDVWKTLKSSKIFLEELALDIVVPSLLEYLASYSGLKKLRLIPGGFCEGSSSDSMARQFFSIPFINHVQSLEDLTICPPYEGSWCFGPWNQTIVSRCINLKTLHVAIVSAQLGNPGDKPQEVSVGPNVIGLLIDTVSTSMPRLENLIISAANLECLRMARCGNPAMNHFTRTLRDMLLSVNVYRSLPICHPLPHLTVSNDSAKTFVPTGPDADGRLHYTLTNPSSQDNHNFYSSFY